MLAGFQILQAKNIKIDSTFSTDSEIFPFEKGVTISSLSLTGKVTLENELSLIRIILTDANENEFLIYEAYPNIEDSLIVNMTDESLETDFLDNIVPKSLRIQVIDGEISINYIKISSDFTKLKYSEMELNTKAKIKEKNQKKISNLKKNIEKKGLTWFAGETSISNLSYVEKKKLFGGEKFNSYGFEFYKGGLFILPDSSNTFSNILNKQNQVNPQPENIIEEEDLAIESIISTIKDGGETTTSTTITSFEGMIGDFDWRNQHGINWNTSVKSQFSGTCWAFGAVGATEAMVNLYFNNKLDLDLSEQEMVSCTGGSCSGGTGGGSQALSYIQNTGIVNQECFENGDCNAACSDKCSSPTETITIDGYQTYNPNSYSNPESELKRFLINNGVLSGRISSWGHTMTLSGFGTVKAGDVLYQGITNGYKDTSKITIVAGDSRIGSTYWIFKNSWGSGWGDNGYALVLSNINQLIYTRIINTPITSLNFDDSDIQCLDVDGDGYYNWGIGNKPTHCPPCPVEPDGNDVDPNIGPVDEDGAFSTNLPYSFGFENGLGGWRQSSNDDVDWTRKSGSTSSSGTGPSSAYEGSYYMYVEASSPNYPSKTSFLVSPSFNLTTGCNANFKFNYHMYGSTMGSLELQISTDGGENWDTELWSISGDQGDSWKSTTVSLSGYTGNLVKLRFVATTGSSYTSDIAIDNISVTESLSSTQYITNTQTWSNYRSLCGHLTVQSGGKLTITGNLIMPYSANVTVNSGSELIIDGGKLVNSNITINNGGKLTIKNNGTVVINNDQVTINTGGLFDLLYGEVQVFKK